MFNVKFYVGIITPFALLMSFGCSNARIKEGRVLIVYPQIEVGTKIYVTCQPLRDEKAVVIDSAVVGSSRDSLRFNLKDNNDRVYTIRSTFNNYEFSFIVDSKKTIVTIDYFSRANTVTNSSATLSFRKFMHRQDSLSNQIGELQKQIDSLSHIGSDKNNLKESESKRGTATGVYHQNFINYADTVKSPVAFLTVYNQIDFGKDTKALRAFMNKASIRFFHNITIQAVVKDALTTASIYEEEYNVGDKLPAITLNDPNYIPFSTSQLAGQYYLIDFWTTYCEQCFPFKEQERKIFEKYPMNKLRIVSVALDDQKTVWNEIIKKRNYEWVQLIDEQMWKGVAVQTLKFDSIPYNFLVNPNGKVIAKALNAQDLLQVISDKVK